MKLDNKYDKIIKKIDKIINLTSDISCTSFYERKYTHGICCDANTKVLYKGILVTYTYYYNTGGQNS